MSLPIQIPANTRYKQVTGLGFSDFEGPGISLYRFLQITWKPWALHQHYKFEALQREQHRLNDLLAYIHEIGRSWTLHLLSEVSPRQHRHTWLQQKISRSQHPSHPNIQNHQVEPQQICQTVQQLNTIKFHPDKLHCHCISLAPHIPSSPRVYEMHNHQTTQALLHDIPVNCWKW